MFWENLLVNRPLSTEEVQATVSRLFGVDPIDTLVVADIAEADIPSTVRVLCELGQAGGEFPTKLDIYLRDRRLEATDRREFVGRLSAALDCICLMPSESPNPYEMLLVSGVHDQRLVRLDPIRLDDFGEYVVWTESLTTGQEAPLDSSVWSTPPTDSD